jgi:hypothetical protein
VPGMLLLAAGIREVVFEWRRAAAQDRFHPQLGPFRSRGDGKCPRRRFASSFPVQSAAMCLLLGRSWSSCG